MQCKPREDAEEYAEETFVGGNGEVIHSRQQQSYILAALCARSPTHSSDEKNFDFESVSQAFVYTAKPTFFCISNSC